jgi:glycine dehydrogenase subunit 1
LGQNPYSPHTEADRAAMLARIGITSVDELLTAVPKDARGPAMGVPPGLSEMEVQAHLERIAAIDRPAGAGPFFIGGPVQRRYIPAAVPVLALRGEFLTAYTPYQPEVSQGTLQAIWEYQSLMAELLALDVVNSSMYDGSTAMAEAALMAVRLTGRRRVVVANEIFAQYRQTLATYAKGPELDVIEVPTAELAANAANAACLIVQHPDALGTLVDVRTIADAAHAAGGLCVQVVEPHANALLDPPGALGVDIAVGEGQPLGIPLSFGGPHLGIIACREPLVRQMPGRIVGQTVDSNGTRGFVNTLQTREQHIRREKATSNICTNEALAAIMASVYLSLMGPASLRAAARLGVLRAHQLADKLAALPGVTIGTGAPFFDRFALRTPLAGELRTVLMAEGILVGEGIGLHYTGVGDGVTIQCTELTTPADIDALVEAVQHSVRAAAAVPLPRKPHSGVATS